MAFMIRLHNKMIHPNHDLALVFQIISILDSPRFKKTHHWRNTFCGESVRNAGHLTAVSTNH